MTRGPQIAQTGRSLGAAYVRRARRALTSSSGRRISWLLVPATYFPASSGNQSRYPNSFALQPRTWCRRLLQQYLYRGTGVAVLHHTNSCNSTHPPHSQLTLTHTMDVVDALQGRDIPAILGPSWTALSKILETRRSEIENHPQQTFQYGSTDRHKLDVYYPDPSTVSPDKPVPVLFFIYGGGFVNGDRKMAPPFDLAYTNVGVFFAKRGILTVIPDYRLFPHATYPGPVEDVRDALAWVLSNGPAIASSPSSTLPPATALSSLFVLSQSAGTTHAMSLFLSPALLPLDAPVRAATRGLVPSGGAYAIDFSKPVPMPPGVLEGYYGGADAARAHLPLQLLADAPAELVKGLPDVFVLRSAKEPAFIEEGNDAFVGALEGRLGRKVRYEVMERHNHVSPHLALLTGDGEAWAEDVVAWVKARV